MSEATLLKTGARPVLRFERHLPKPAGTVWRAVTDPVEMRTWFPTRIEIDEWRVGAALTHYFDDHDIEPLPGTVLEWDPPRRVSFTWGPDTISFELTPAPDGGTTFVLTEELSANHWSWAWRASRGSRDSNTTWQPSNRSSVIRTDRPRDTASQRIRSSGPCPARRGQEAGLTTPEGLAGQERGHRRRTISCDVASRRTRRGGTPANVAPW